MQNNLTVSDFTETQMKQYSKYDSERSLPHIMDGLKITSRKVIKTMTNGRLNTKDIKVAQLKSYVALENSFHHGEDGISNVIIGMAQNFPGSNNINLMMPVGQFGSKLNPKGASAARYIETNISDSFKLIYKKEDFDIVEKQYDESLEIEPKYFLPILPMILINGSEGIGTGYASKIFNRDPKLIIDYILDKISKKKPKIKLIPSYINWTGKIESTDIDNQYKFYGKLEKIGSNKIRITELPIGMSQSKIVSNLVSLMDDNIINDFDDNSNESNGFDITVYCPRALTSKSEQDLLDTFGLISKDTENLTCWLPTDDLFTFKSPEELCDYFISFRVSKYESRRLSVIDSLTKEISMAEERKRFIELYLKNAKQFSGITKSELVTLLTEKKFVNIDKLLDIKIYNLTKDAIDKLIDEIIKLNSELTYYNSVTAEQLYELELKDLKKNLKY